MKNGIQKAGYAVVTQHEIIEAKALTPNTLAQKAELIALMRALELTQEKTLNIWTDSKFAFGVVHAHGAIWKERAVNLSEIPSETWRNNAEIVRGNAVTLKGGNNAL